MIAHVVVCTRHRTVDETNDFFRLSGLEEGRKFRSDYVGKGIADDFFGMHRSQTGHSFDPQFLSRLFPLTPAARNGVMLHPKGSGIDTPFRCSLAGGHVI